MPDCQGAKYILGRLTVARIFCRATVNRVSLERVFAGRTTPFLAKKMRLPILSLATAISVAALLSSCSGGKAQESGLRVEYGSNGIQHLSYNGVVLEDLDQHPADTFHIWHMKATGSGGKVAKDGQYGWGELNNGHTWDAATHTWKYVFTWGQISVQFAQAGNTLNMNVTEVNNEGSPVTFDGATIYPFVLHFPQLPKGFGDPQYAHVSPNLPGSSSPVADFGQGQVTVTVADSSKPLYHGFEPAGGEFSYFPIISSTSMDSLAPTMPHIDRPLASGQTDSYTVALQFAPSASAEK